jgi:hypothetical protein
MAATVVGAIDQQPGYASYPHFPKGDLLLSHAHDSPIERDGKPLRLVGVQGQATAIRHLDRNFVPFASLGLSQSLEPLARDSQPSVALNWVYRLLCAFASIFKVRLVSRGIDFHSFLKSRTERPGSLDLFRRPKPRRIGPFVHVRCGVCLPGPFEQSVLLRTWPKLNGLSFQLFGECGETIFE